MGRGSRRGTKQPFDLDASKLPSPPATATENERLLACLGYLSQIVLPLVLPILLLSNRNTRQSGFVHHHAVQAIALVGVGIIYDLLAVLVLLLLRSQEQLLVLGLALLLIPPIFVSLLYGVKGLRGQWAEIPLVTNLLKDTDLL